MDIMRQSACLVVNPIKVYSYGFLFNCMTVGQASNFKNGNNFLTSKLLKQGFQYHKLRIVFSKFHFRSSELLNTIFA